MEFKVSRDINNNNITIFACYNCGNATSLTCILNHETVLDDVVTRAINLALATVKLTDITHRQMHVESVYKACASKIVIQRAYRLSYKDIENDVFVSIDKILSSIASKID